MAFIDTTYHSRTLKLPVQLSFIVPSKKDAKVLFLLHDAFGDRTNWLLYSQITLLAEKNNILVCLMSVRNSFYINTENGYNYYDFITEELPSLVKNMFKVSKERKDWMIAGASMGGYGALRCGLGASDIFSHIAAFSPCCDIVKRYDEIKFINTLDIFGTKDKLIESDNNIYVLCKKFFSDDAHNPMDIYITCGLDDFLLEDNREFAKVFKNHGITFDFGEGEHNYLTWNNNLIDAVNRFCRDKEDA